MNNNEKNKRINDVLKLYRIVKCEATGKYNFIEKKYIGKIGFMGGYESHQKALDALKEQLRKGLDDD